jgi:septal ring factor EnvC (AmiA/AmiB activator)
MNLAQDLRTRAKHRGMKPWELIQKIGRLERESAAKDREADALTCTLVQLATEVDGLKRERNDLKDSLDAAAVDYAGLNQDLEAANAEVARLRDELAPHRAAEANVNAVDVPPMERDTSAVEDQATAPIEVLTLPQAFGTDPAHVPSWARDTDTQPIPRANPAA